MMKQASEETATNAGDGTTTAIVLTEALVEAGMKWIKPHHNVAEVLKDINKHAEEIGKFLKKERSKKLNKSRLLDVATISANNDKEIGKIIADAYNSVGKDGIVTVERSQTEKTYSEITHGIKIDRGYSSPMFINNHKKDECIMDNVKVLVADQDISNILQIENILKPIINAQEKLLIIGSLSDNVVNTLAANVVRNGLKFCHIPVPSFGYRTHELMQDIALAIGAKCFSEKTGDDLSLVRMEDLGLADKVIVGKDNTVIIKDNQVTDEITKRVEELREQQKNKTFTKAERDFVNERIASLVGGIGCIYVGGNSDIEQKEKFDRVDDSVCAVRSALQEGIIPGGGLALYDCSFDFEPKEEYNEKYDEEQCAKLIMRDALQAPMKQILCNAGKDVDDVMHADLIQDEGFDVKKGKYGDMFKMGIVDPVKVTRNALLNAASVATTILSTNAIVTHARQ
tara:strand:- start:10123 stop:11490 length:1368 start_codon:yes stop_codon:yes gene_type:complete